MIYYPIETLVGAGIREILVVTGGKNAGEFLRLLGQREGVRLRHINYTYQEGEGGIAAGAGPRRVFCGGRAGVRDSGRQHPRKGSIAPYVDNFRKQKSGSRILLKEVNDPERFGVADIRGARSYASMKNRGFPRRAMRSRECTCTMRKCSIL